MKTAVKIETIKVSEIVPNENNPRIIKEDKFQRLVESIKTFPEMLHVRPLVIDENNVVLGGNMRLKACIEAGLKDLPVIRCTNWSEERKTEFIIKDNVGFGEWDWNILANEWDDLPLNEWGVAVWETKTVDYSILDDEDFSEKLDEMESDVRKAIQIPFESDDYEEARELYKELSNSGEYVGGIILETLRNQK